MQLVDGSDQSSSIFVSYPVTVCVRQLPKGMPVGEEINEDVRVQAFFVKLWAYRTQENGSVGQPAMEDRAIQFSPLLIGRQPQWLRRRVATSPYPGLAIGVIFAAAMATLCYRVWKASRNDRASRSAIHSNRFAFDKDHPLANLDPKSLDDGGERQHELDS